MTKGTAVGPKVYADVVVGIPLSGGRKMWKKVGVMMQYENNDDAKGPGFSILLDRFFNPAGVPSTREGETSVSLNCYWPKPFESQAKPGDPGMDDDIPF